MCLTISTAREQPHLQSATSSSEPYSQCVKRLTRLNCLSSEELCEDGGEPGLEVSAAIVRP
jgi:hypothetical protein